MANEGKAQNGQDQDATEKQSMTRQDVQKQLAQTQQAVAQIMREFGEVGGVNPDGALLLFKAAEAQGEVDIRELNQTDLEALMADVCAYDVDPSHETAKNAYIGQLFTAYIVQHAVTQNTDAIIDDHFGMPTDALPAIPGVSNQPLAQFSVFKTTDANEQAAMIQSAANDVYGAAEEGSVMADALTRFEDYVELAARQEAVLTGRDANPDRLRFTFMKERAVFARYPQNVLFDDIKQLLDDGFGIEEGGMIDRLQQGIDAINRLPKPAFSGPKYSIRNGQKLDFDIKPISVTDDGQTLVALDHVRQQIGRFTREELINKMKTAQNPELAGLFLGIAAFEVAGRMPQKENDDETVYRIDLHKEVQEEDIWVAYESAEDLKRRYEEGKIGAHADPSYPNPHPIKMRRLNEDARVIASVTSYDVEAMDKMASARFITDHVLPDLVDEAKDSDLLKGRLDAVAQSILAQGGMAGYVSQTIKNSLTKPLSMDEVAARAENEKEAQQPQSTHWQDAYQKMQELAQGHEEALEEYKEKKERRENHTACVLARGRQSDKAYKIWSEIYNLPKEKQPAAQLKAFCPSVADDVHENAIAVHDGDYIELALKSWTEARMADVKQALGEMSPTEEALMYYTLDSARDTMRYIVMMELAAYDPTLFMRKEKGVYYKHLDKACETYKPNGGVDPLQNVERHVVDWNGWGYDGEERGPSENLIDIVEYKTTDGRENSDHESYHHAYTNFYCISDFYNNAKKAARSSSLDYIGLSGLANRMMRRDSPQRQTREVAQAILANGIGVLGIEASRLDKIIALSTKVNNRPAETKDERFAGTSLMTADYVRWRDGEAVKNAKMRTQTAQPS